MCDIDVIKGRKCLKLVIALGKLLLCQAQGVLPYQEVGGGGGGLAPKFASEILVGAPNFASKNIDDK